MEINFVKKLTTFLDEPTNGEFYTGKSLAEAIKEKVGALKGELNRLEAIRQLQSEKDASQF
ncbi:hypothetical protein FACS1894176_00460 [Bacteroidia bacterium]|nr:hypothetical protein FACS1894176_00460 [Bacteroidia bacterium]